MKEGTITFAYNNNSNNYNNYSSCHTAELFQSVWSYDRQRARVLLRSQTHLRYLWYDKVRKDNPQLSANTFIKVKRSKIEDQKYCIALYRKPVTELWSVTCHTRSHNLTCRHR